MSSKKNPARDDFLRANSIREVVTVTGLTFDRGTLAARRYVHQKSRMGIWFPKSMMWVGLKEGTIEVNADFFSRKLKDLEESYGKKRVSIFEKDTARKSL